MKPRRQRKTNADDQTVQEDSLVVRFISKYVGKSILFQQSLFKNFLEHSCSFLKNVSTSTYYF